MRSSAVDAGIRLDSRSNSFFSRLILMGLAGIIWFSTFARAAHDLWASCIVFGMFTLLVWLFLIDRYRTRRSIRLPLWGPISLLITVLIVSNFHSYDFATSRHELWTWFFSFVGFYLFVNTAPWPDRPRTFFMLCAIVLIPLAMICLHQQVTGKPEEYGQFHLLGFIFRYGRWEIPATLVNSIVLSAFALSWFFFLWELDFRQPLPLLLFASLVIVLLLGRSWWAAISLAAGFSFYYKDHMYKMLRRRRFAVLGVVFGLLLLFLLILFFKFDPHQGHRYSGMNRVGWWQSAWRMAFHHPVWGIGLGAFGIAYPFFKVPGIQGTLYAHSFPLQWMAETGFLGLSAIGWLAWNIVSNSPSIDKNKVRRMCSREAILATLATLLVYSMITISMEYFLNKLLMLLIIGCLFIQEQDHELQVRPSIWMIPIAAGFMALIPFWLAPLQAGRRFINAYAFENRGDWFAARSEFENALALDPHDGDLYAAIAQTYKHDYFRTRSPMDLDQWRRYLDQAIRWKKDIRYLAERSRSPV